MKNKILKGIVIHGSGDGHKIGFPTANIQIEHLPKIQYGVYACQLRIADSQYLGVMHFGPRMIFNERHPQFEVHILDFDRDIYDQNVEVIVLQFIRDTIKFDSFDELITQIKADIVKCRQYFAKLSVT